MMNSRLSYGVMRFMGVLQRRVRRYPTVVQAIRSVRNLIHFGPWRRLILAYERRASPPRSAEPDQPSVLLSPPDVAAAVQALERDGYYQDLQVCPRIVNESASLWVEKPPGIYIDCHLVSQALNSVVTDPAIWRIVRAYFGCEPSMVECKLFVLGANQPDILATGYHFDHAGARSLNLLMYLTDVDERTAAHTLVAGTHRKKTLRDYLREYVPIGEIERRYPERIRTITGKAGLLLLENAEVFHRRMPAMERRVAMIAVFSSSGRRLLSIGKDHRRTQPPKTI